jgi:pimeloyl-ACP methyl ester carboxylesterase
MAGISAPVTAQVRVPTAGVVLAGDLVVPEEARGIVVFAHGSGSGRRSPRNRYVGAVLQDAGLATLLFDLLTEEEERIDLRTGELRFDIPLLADRLVGAVDWVGTRADTRALPLGVFGASTGAAAALIAAAERPDLAGAWLGRVRAPTLLIVGGRDETVIELNRSAMARTSAPTRLEIVPEATHLFEEPGKLEAVAGLARDWFVAHLGRADRAS